jgi:drug/metabolite transporter (DMT)-like permease
MSRARRACLAKAHAVLSPFARVAGSESACRTYGSGVAALATFEQRLSALTASVRASGAAGKRNEPVVAFVWVTIAMASFAGLGTFAKLSMNAGLPALEVVFFRNLFCFLFLLPLLHWRGPSIATSRQMHLYGARVGLALVSMLLWFSALALIPLAELTAMSFLAPLMATLFAVVWLGETVRARRWTALAIGFVGALVILRPGVSPFGLGQMFALGTVVINGIIGPLLKQMTAEDDADKIVFISNMLLTPLSLIPALFVWQWPSQEVMPWLIAMGLCAVIGHIALMRGFASTDASLVFTFEFSRLPFSVLVGLLVLGEATDMWTWIGATIIFASALYITRREASLARRGAMVSPRACSDPLMVTPVGLKYG